MHSILSKSDTKRLHVVTTPTSGGILPALLMLALAVPFLQGCPAFVVGGVATGAAVIHDRRDAQTVLADQQIELQAMQLLHENPDIAKRSRIAATSYNHMVLLTGQAETRAAAERFANLVSRLPKVRRVVDEVAIGPLASFMRESEDVLVTSRVKLAITEVDYPDFDATRTKVVTEAGVVYLMGLVTPGEADAVVEQARYVPGVKKVIKVFEYTQPSAKTSR
jgi:osmotically-inducible protein OsmY